jgi:hypothetical protein
MDENKTEHFMGSGIGILSKRALAADENLKANIITLILY